MTIRPIGKRVYVEPIAAEEKSSSGKLFLPSGITRAGSEYIVVAIGPEAIGSGVNPGDRVLCVNAAPSVEIGVGKVVDLTAIAAVIS